MDEQIKKQVSVYFSCFYKHTQKWKTLIEKSQRPLSALKNQTEQLMHVERVDIGTEFSDFPDLKEKLLFKIYTAIDEELSLLKSILLEFSAALQELRNKLFALDKCTVNVDWDNDKSICGSALQPSLSDLMQMALTGCRIYTDAYHKIANSLKCLNIRTAKSLSELTDSLRDVADDRVNHIIAMTQYCYD